MKRLTKIRTLVFATAAALGIQAAYGQEFPSRPLKFIVPYAPGGAADVVARTIAPPMSETLGQQLVVENRVGAGGIPGFEALAKSEPDGYTLIIGDSGQWAINPALYTKLPYDPVRDLAPIGFATTVSLFIVTNESFPAKNLRELIALVKSKPGAFNYASAGTGTLHHLTMEAFKAALGLEIVHVPYKGSGQATPALVSGEVPMSIAALTAITQHVKAGKVRVLAVTTKKRSIFAPDVPPVEEFGVHDFDFPGEQALFTRAGTPRPHIDKLAAALGQAVRRPDVVKRFAAFGAEPVTDSTPERLAQTVRADIERYARAVKVSGAKAD